MGSEAAHPDMERPLSTVIFLFFISLLFRAQQRGLLRQWISLIFVDYPSGTEPTLIFFVASFAFYGHEFGPFETNLSYRMDASSSVVPTLLSIKNSLVKINVLNEFSFGPSQEDQGRKKTVHS